MDRRLATRQRVCLLSVGLVALAAWSYARGQETVAPTAPATAAVSVPATQRSAAAEAAWSGLQLLRNYVHASRLRDPQQRTEEFMKARKDLVAAAYLGDKATPLDVETLATLWPAEVAHYVDGFQRERLIVVQTGEHDAMASITAVNPEDQEAADKLAAQIRKDLESQGFSGHELQSRQQVLLKRKLAEQGIGMPLAATIQLNLRNVNGAWKLRSVSLVPPAAGSRPAAKLPQRGPAVFRGPAAASQATQPAR